MKPFKKVDGQDICAFIEIMDKERVLLGEAIRDDYDHDEMTEYGHFKPDAVLLAVNTDEISKTLKYCNEHHIAVTPRGAGTGLCGGCVATKGGIILSTEKMNHILEIDEKNMTATVEPGVLLMEFAKMLEGSGLFYPPDPGEKSATMGGNVMTNAGGMRAVRFGVTRDYVLGMEIVLADGSILDVGGKIVKNSSGYSLLDLLIGSEGTLAFLSRITVKLVPCPKSNVTLLIPFEDLDHCIDAVPQVLLSGAEPTAVEFMESEVINAAEEYLGKQFPDKSANAYLLIRLDGSCVQALEKPIDTLTDLLLSLGAKDVLLADTEERKASIWDARGAFLEAIKGGTPSMDECDVVVPRDEITAFVKKSVEVGKQYHVRICSFGHAGDGNLHIYACKDQMSEKEWEEKRSLVMNALYSEAIKLQGQVSGEHGIGHAKTAFLRESLGERSIKLMQAIKKAFDPNGIINPGKIAV